jgi:pilus assembly protein CpaE
MAALGLKAPDRREALRVHLIGETAEALGVVKAVLDAVSEPALEVVEMSPNAPVEEGEVADIAMVVFGANEAAPLGYLQTHAARSPRPIIFALLQDHSPTLMRRVLHAGADELLLLPLESADLTRALMKLNERRRRAERVGRGVIYGVASLVGGVGVSTLSANLALAMRYVFGKRAAVVDLDLQNGGLNVVLHLDPEQTIASLIEFTAKLDSIKIEAALTKHPSGIYLLAAPRRLDNAERVTDLTIAEVLDLMRQLFDFVVVDCGSHVDEITVATWERCDELLYVVDHSRVATHCARRFRDLFGRLGLRLDEPRFILNKFDAQNAITEEVIAQAMGVSCFAKIPRDDRMLEKMQLRVQDLWQLAPNSALARAIEALARRINARREPVVEVSEGFVARLFSVFGARA